MSPFELLWPDVVWHVIPLIAVYQILSTIRHELSHAIAFWLSGYGVKAIYILPHRDESGRFYWGRIIPETKAGAHMNVHVHLAPYYSCVLAGVIWALVCRYAAPPWVEDMRLSWNLWAAFTIMFLISPIVDLTYNLIRGLKYQQGDFEQARLYWQTH